MTGATEQRQVLDMLAEGKITAEEAQQLLDKLNAGKDGGPAEGGRRASPGQKPKYLCIRAAELDGEEINLRIPLGFVKSGLVFGAMMPDWVAAKVAVNGVDLSRLSSLEGDELIDALHELDIVVDSIDGGVRIYCE